MSEALEALEAALTDVLDEIEHSRKADAMEETLALYQLRGFAQTRLELALGDLDTLRAALSAEGVGDAEIEAIRGRHEAAERNSRWDDIEHYGDDAHADRATLLRKVDELTRAAKET